jgi:hypothetical protein
VVVPHRFCRHRAFLPCAFLLFFCSVPAAAQTPPTAASQPAAQIKVFLDCESCFRDYLQEEVVFVNYVRDRLEADVHVLITVTETGAGGREYTAAFTGLGSLQGVDHTLRAVTTPSDTEDMIRRQLATTLRIGLLNYVTRGGVPQRLNVDVELGTEKQRPAVAGDRWNNWVFSVRASGSVEGEESQRQLQFGGSASADRITPEWKITIGAFYEHQREEFDLDEDEPVSVRRRESEVDTLVVKAAGEHWSFGGGSEIRSSTFDNVEFGVDGYGAVEFNVFPYSEYTRRQLRSQYAAGLRHARYYEETLFGELEETRPLHNISSTFEQRERWGSLHARIELEQYLHDLGKYRIEADGEISWRLARGLSLSAEGSASRIRDQLSLPRRGATEEEILLRLRQLASGYEYDFQISVTYTFGSIFSAIVNPRFGS